MPSSAEEKTDPWRVEAGAERVAALTSGVGLLVLSFQTLGMLPKYFLLNEESSSVNTQG